MGFRVADEGCDVVVGKESVGEDLGWGKSVHDMSVLASLLF